MNVLLIQPSWTSIYGRFQNAARKAILYPPLGLCYIGTLAKDLGHTVKFLDGEVDELTEEKIKETLQAFEPDLIGLTATTPVIEETKRLLSLCRKYSEALLVLGGPHATIVKEEIFKECLELDAAVIGEGEETFKEILEAFSNHGKDSHYGVGGVLPSPHHKNGHVFHERAFLKNLDALPFPDRSLLKNEKYFWSIPHKGKLKFTTMLTSRGCPFKCTFCSEPFLSKGFVRYRSAENCVAEMDEITGKYGLNMIGFVDDTLTLKKERIIQMCELIVKMNINVHMDCWTHANCVDENLLSWMKKAGFLRVCFGIESGDEQVLKATKKNVTLERLKEAFRLSRKVGLETCGYAIVGLPHDTKESVRKTIAFMRDFKDLNYGFLSIASPLPGTEMYDMAQRGEGGMKLLDGNAGAYQRYDKTSLQVNDLSDSDLVRMQKFGFLSIYTKPHRIFYLLKRVPLREVVENILIFMRSVFSVDFAVENKRKKRSLSISMTTLKERSRGMIKALQSLNVF